MGPPGGVKPDVPGSARTALPTEVHRRPPSFCVVVPTYNNQLTLGGVIKDILKATPDLVVVDDGSTDGAGQVLRAIPGITVITHERNLGKGAALVRGLRFASQAH